MIRQRIVGGLRRAAPQGTQRRAIARVAYRPIRIIRNHTTAKATTKTYHEWLRRTQPGTVGLREEGAISAQWRYRPLVTICVPVYNPLPEWIDAMVKSVRAQSYDSWQLCLVDDHSPDPRVRQLLEQIAAVDERIVVVLSTENGGISRATNQALNAATGEFIAFLDHDDVLAPQALFAVVKHLQEHPDTDLFYSDEDMLDPEGRRVQPFFKPDWSPQTLLSFNYITHFVVARKSLVDSVGKLRPECDGAQDHDLLLRMTENTDRIHHIADILYSWRQSAGSVASRSDAKPWAYPANLKTIGDALERRGIKGTARPGIFPGAAIVDYEIATPHPRVSIVIPTRDRIDLLRACIDSIETVSTYDNYTITILDNDSADADAIRYMQGSRHAVVACPGPFNYSAIVNRGVAHTDGEFVITLNNDTQIRTPDWIERLLGFCQDPGVAMVGCHLLRPSGGSQHEGIAVGSGTPTAVNLAVSIPGLRFVPQMRVTHEVSAVTGACVMTRRSAWDEVNGLDETLPVAFNDVDFCLRVIARGHRILYTPLVEVMHRESASRGDLSPPEDEKLFSDRWGITPDWVDPYMSPHVTWRPGSWAIKLP